MKPVKKAKAITVEELTEVVFERDVYIFPNGAKYSGGIKKEITKSSETALKVASSNEKVPINDAKGPKMWVVKLGLFLVL